MEGASAPGFSETFKTLTSPILATVEKIQREESRATFQIFKLLGSLAATGACLIGRVATNFSPDLLYLGVLVSLVVGFKFFLEDHHLEALTAKLGQQLSALVKKVVTTKVETAEQKALNTFLEEQAPSVRAMTFEYRQDFTEGVRTEAQVARLAELLQKINPRQLELIGYRNISQPVIVSFTAMSHLSGLNLSYSTVSDELLPLLAKCQNLRTLKLVGCPFITAKGLIQLGEAGSKIHHLQLAYSLIVKNDVLARSHETQEEFYKYELIPSQKRAVTSGQTQFADYTMELTEEELSFLPKFKLTSLSVSHVGDKALAYIAQTCSVLTELDLHSGLTLTGATFDALSHTPLEQIHFEDCISMSSAGIAKLAHLKTLKEIRFITPLEPSLKECSFEANRSSLESAFNLDVKAYAMGGRTVGTWTRKK